ncbi:MAG: c-type cytochrome [Acidobacteriota bacterium]
MKRNLKFVFLAIFAATAFGVCFAPQTLNIPAPAVLAQTTPTPPVPDFDQKAAIAKLREQIKGKEQLPASEVFKNVKTPMLKDRPAGQLLAVMEFGFVRSLGVNCTHCHVPDKWEAEDRPQKQIAREMSAMMATLNDTMLKGIKNLKSATPTVNCTTCHRGEVKPALNLPQPRS